MRYLGRRSFYISFFVLYFLNVIYRSQLLVNIPTLLFVSRAIAVLAMVWLLINFLYITSFCVKDLIRERKKWIVEFNKKSLSEKNAIRTKRRVGYFVWFLIFVVFPPISMHFTGMCRLLGAIQGPFFGKVALAISWMMKSSIDGLLISSLNIYLLPLFIMAFYFIFSRNQRKRLDSVLYLIVIVLLFFVIWNLPSLHFL